MEVLNQHHDDDHVRLCGSAGTSVFPARRRQPPFSPARLRPRPALAARRLAKASPSGLSARSPRGRVGELERAGASARGAPARRPEPPEPTVTRAGVCRDPRAPLDRDLGRLARLVHPAWSRPELAASLRMVPDRRAALLTLTADSRFGRCPCGTGLKKLTNTTTPIPDYEKTCFRPCSCPGGLSDHAPPPRKQSAAARQKRIAGGARQIPGSVRRLQRLSYAAENGAKRA